MRVVSISVDDPKTTKDLSQKAGYTFTMLSDPGAEVARRYDLYHAGAGVKGAAVARPAEFVLDRGGVVRWRNLTEDYRVRARAEEMLAQAKLLSKPQ